MKITGDLWVTMMVMALLFLSLVIIFELIFSLVIIIPSDQKNLKFIMGKSPVYIDVPEIVNKTSKLSLVKNFEVSQLQDAIRNSINLLGKETQLVDQKKDDQLPTIYGIYYAVVVVYIILVGIFCWYFTKKSEYKIEWKKVLYTLPISLCFVILLESVLYFKVYSNMEVIVPKYTMTQVEIEIYNQYLKTN